MFRIVWISFFIHEDLNGDHTPTEVFDDLFCRSGESMGSDLKFSLQFTASQDLYFVLLGSFVLDQKILL